MKITKVNIRLLFNRFKFQLLESDCLLCMRPVNPDTNHKNKAAEHTDKTRALQNSTDNKPQLAQVTNQPLICSYCHDRLPLLKSSCAVCAMPIASNQYTCGGCLQYAPAFCKTVSAFHYTPPVDKFIQAMKYHAQFNTLGLLTSHLAKNISDTYPKNSLPSLMVPVPLFKAKLKHRGFNQASEIAKRLQKKLKMPFSNQIIERIKNTNPQSDLNAEERKKNLIGAFKVNISPPPYVAVIDDVMTTGSTANEVAKQLMLSGCERVDIWCLSRAFPVD